MTPDPSTSSQDPTNTQSWNRYPYVLGDPVNSNDPTGLDTTEVCSEDNQDPNCGGGGVMLPPDPTGYCPPSEQSCAPLPGDGGVGPGGGGQPFAPGSNQGGTQTCPPGYVYVMGTCLPYAGTIWFKVTLPGTNWCGPGGHGPTLNPLDASCEQHDACYAEAEAGHIPGWLTNTTGIGRRAVRVRLQGCNVRLCDSVGGIMSGGVPPPSAPWAEITMYEEAQDIWNWFKCSSIGPRH
jgi:hypothetical protein